MTLILAHKTTDAAEAMVVVSKLKAGGFEPHLFDYFHGLIAIGYLEALGGLRIYLPEDQIKPAIEFMKTGSSIADFDPIPAKPIKDVFFASVLLTNPFFFMCLFPPFLLLLLWCLWVGAFYHLSGTALTISILANSILLYLILMLAHAKYIAVPRLRNSHES